MNFLNKFDIQFSLHHSLKSGYNVFIAQVYLKLITLKLLIYSISENDNYIIIITVIDVTMTIYILFKIWSRLSIVVDSLKIIPVLDFFVSRISIMNFHHGFPSRNESIGCFNLFSLRSLPLLSEKVLARALVYIMVLE